MAADVACQMAADSDAINDMDNDIIWQVAADVAADLDDNDDVGKTWRDDVEFLGPLDWRALF
jgi:hypothetical protein